MVRSTRAGVMAVFQRVRALDHAMMVHGLYSGLADSAYHSVVFFAGSLLLMSVGTAWGCACMLVDCPGYICYLPVQVAFCMSPVWVAFTYLLCAAAGDRLLFPQCQRMGLR